jgi:hypothetical protein
MEGSSANSFGAYRVPRPAGHESLPNTRGRLRCLYAAFFAALIFAHRAFCVAAIFLREDADMVRLAGVAPVAFASAAAGCDCLRTLAHRFLCASAILRREAREMTRLGCDDLCNTPAPCKGSIPEITWSNFSISICALLRFWRSSLSAFSKFDMVTPSDILMRSHCIGED